jgi:hypothetical protein
MGFSCRQSSCRDALVWHSVTLGAMCRLPNRDQMSYSALQIEPTVPYSLISGAMCRLMARCSGCLLRRPVAMSRPQSLERQRGSRSGLAESLSSIPT